MDSVDRQLLDLLQGEFPLVPAPFAALGERLGLDEAEVLKRTRQLKEEGLIRQIGPILDSNRLGYRSTLVAFRVEPERLDQVAEQVAALPAVSHCYSREYSRASTRANTRAHAYNLWFTLTLPGEEDLSQVIADLARAGDVADFLNLPALRIFKLGVYFSMRENSPGVEAKLRPELCAGPGPRQSSGTLSEGTAGQAPLSSFEQDLVRALQGELPLTERPFLPAAAQLMVHEATVVEGIQELARRGVLRRFGAVLRHRQAGFRANGMVCWVVPEERIEEVGRAASALPQVSHCYQRPAFPPRWPYTLFTMVHGHERAEVGKVVEQIEKAVGAMEHQVLYSLQEYKKERVTYQVG